MDIPKLQHRAAQTSQLSTCIQLTRHISGEYKESRALPMKKQQSKSACDHFQKLEPVCLQSFLDTSHRSPARCPKVGPGCGYSLLPSLQDTLMPPHLSAGVPAGSIYPTLVLPYSTHVDEQCKVPVWSRQTQVRNHGTSFKTRRYVTLKAACTSGSCRSKQASNNAYQRVIYSIVRAVSNVSTIHWHK